MDDWAITPEGISSFTDIPYTTRQSRYAGLPAHKAKLYRQRGKKSLALTFQWSLLT